MTQEKFDHIVRIIHTTNPYYCKMHFQRNACDQHGMKISPKIYETAAVALVFPLRTAYLSSNLLYTFG